MLYKKNKTDDCPPADSGTVGRILNNKIYIKAKNVWKAVVSFFDRHLWLQCTVIGILLNLTVESLSRHSLLNGLMHSFTSPLVFLFNSLIIVTLLSFAAFSRHRTFYYLLISAVFLGLGITNCVLLYMRITPFEWADLQVVKLSIIKIYLTNFQIILSVSAIIGAIAGLIVLFIKLPKKKVFYVRSIIRSAVFSVLLAVSLFAFRNSGILLSEHVKNLANAYRDYGFNYCFFCSALDLGIDKPSQYDADDVDKMVRSIEAASERNNEVKNAGRTIDGNPNIIFVQLESFFDVNHLNNVSFSEDPIPVFTDIQEKYSSGYLNVPSIGAGTANTEFEIISGMSLSYFGVGEYPYKTVLQTKPSESICNDLAEAGYKSHALHNNTAVFYDRNIVFANLGFDTFTSMEYMNGLEFTPTGWAKDDVLIGCINDALDSSEGADFVYTITVQSHGKYPDNIASEDDITVTGFEDDESEKAAFQYYVNQLHEVDAFIGNLVDSLDKRGEGSVVVFYGDHLPSFSIEQSDLNNNDLFQTEYVIWDNIGLSKTDTTVNSYELGAYIMGKVGIDNGLLTKLHQNFRNNNEKYHKWLEVLEYDMLYGEQFAWGGTDNYPYKQTNLKMGVKDITVSGVEYDAENKRLTVSGQNFTPFSTVFIDNEDYETEMVSTDVLTASNARIKAGSKIYVVQIDESGKKLSSSTAYYIGGTEKHPTVTASSEQIVFKSRSIQTTTLLLIVILVIIVAGMTTKIILYIKSKKSHQQTQEPDNNDLVK